MKSILLQRSECKGTVPSLNEGYFFSNILEIESSIFSLDFINSSNQKILDLIFKLHKEVKLIKKSFNTLKSINLKEEIRMMIILLKMYLFVLRS